MPPTAGSSTADRDAPAGAAFFFDLASPEAYLVAERVLQVVDGPCEWIPVLGAGLPGPHAHEGFRCAEEEAAFREGVERRAAELGLQAVRWPPRVPFDSTLVMRAATFAKGTGRVVAFGLAAFRQAYAGGRDLSRADDVVVAAAACELHPRAVLAGSASRATREALDRATARAADLGVRTVPAVWTGADVLHGEDAPERLAASVAR